MLSAIIVAAGSSRRMRFNKLFAAIAGKPVIAHTIRAFERASSVTEIIVVACEDRHDEIRKIAANESFKKVRSIIGGGEHRQDQTHQGRSIRLALAARRADRTSSCRRRFSGSTSTLCHANTADFRAFSDRRRLSRYLC